jgi:ligand-binding SRPBCC domain-containing protein
MGHVTHQGHVEAPLELVFARAIEPEMTPLLTPSVTSIWDIRGRGDEVGSSYRFRERFLGRVQEGRVEVVAVEPPHRFITLTTYDNGTTVRWEMRFAAAADHGTDGSDVIDYELPAGWRYRIADRLLIRRRIRSSLDQGAARFRAIVEAEAHAV